MITEIDALKHQTNRMFDEALKLNVMFNDAYSKLLYTKFKNQGDVKFKELSLTDLNSEYEIYTFNSEKITTKLIKKTENILVYITTFSSDAIFLRHFHSDCDEIVTILSGGSFKLITGRRAWGDLKEVILNVGDTITIKKNIPHQFINLGEDNSQIKIEFNKNTDED